MRLTFWPAFRPQGKFKNSTFLRYVINIVLTRFVAKSFGTIAPLVLMTPFLAICQTILITFEFQKKEERNERVVMHCSSDPLLCPIRAWGTSWFSLILAPQPLLLSMPTLLLGGKLGYLTGDQVRSLLRLATDCIGVHCRGFNPNKLGTHSICLGSTMGMYLAGIPAFIIKLIGCWNSDAFLC
jgi:hypothetical protein